MNGIEEEVQEQAHANTLRKQEQEQIQQNLSTNEIKINVEKGEETADADASLLRKMLRNKLNETTLDLDVERSDPNSPLHSAKTFEELNLNDALLRGIYAMGFTKPSRIQETVLPALISNPRQSIIAQSQSGTGKTAAFVLVMLSRIDTSKEYPQALCLAPTMELAAQIADVVTRMGQFLKNLKITLATKGQRVAKNVQLTNQIIIGTPGTVLDWADLSTSRYKVFELKKIRAFVLDEADVMISQQGHQDFCVRIHRGLSKSTCQIMFFSATYNPQVIEFASKIVPNPIVIRLRRQEESLKYIKQYFVACKNYEEKLKVVYDVYGLISIGQAIIFCQTKKTAQDVAVQLARDRISVELLSGDLDVEQRAVVIERFREGKSKMLITTNITSRGIDVEDVKLVVNFDLPVDQNRNPDFETYLHRIGRTGRFGKPGIAINLVEPSMMKTLNQIQIHFLRDIKQLDSNDPDEIQKLNSSSQ